MSTMILTFPAGPSAAPGSTPSGPAGGRPRLHLAVARRRRRLGVVLALVVILLAVAAVVPALAGLAGGAGTPPGATGPSSAPVHVVQPGDTLWSIAGAHAPERDVRLVVDELVELNGRAPIVPGERLLLPS